MVQPTLLSAPLPNLKLMWFVCGWGDGCKRGTRKWVPIEVESVYSWPTLGLKSRSKFDTDMYVVDPVFLH